MADPNELCHGMGEAINPGPGSWLYKSTHTAYDYFTGKVRMPGDFFKGLGGDTLGSELFGLSKRFIKSIPQASANLIEAQMSLTGLSGFGF